MRIAVISDVHSNLRALDAVLAAAGPVDRYWHLGDAVGYGPDPDAVVARLRDLGAVSVRGNHDDAVAGGECIRWFVADAQAAAEWTRSVISPQTLAWLEALPLQLSMETPAGSFTLVHGSPANPLRDYVRSAAEARDALNEARTDHCLVGHTHVPRHFQMSGQPGTALEEWQVDASLPARLSEGRAILNPGGVGQPRDGDPRATCMIIDTDAGEAAWHRVEYDIRGTQRAMLEAGLPPALAGRVAGGW